MTDTPTPANDSDQLAQPKQRVTVDVKQLIDQCAREEPQAWPELWQRIRAAVAAPIGRMLRNWGFDESLADDVMQELSLYLLAQSLRRLLRYRGTSDEEFAAFVRVIAARFTLRLMRKWHRIRRQEFEAIESLPTPDRNGPTESQIQTILNDLQGNMSEADVNKLHVLCNGMIRPNGHSAEQPSERTLRRWRHQLRNKLIG